MHLAALVRKRCGNWHGLRQTRGSGTDPNSRGFLLAELASPPTDGTSPPDATNACSADRLAPAAVSALPLAVRMVGSSAMAATAGGSFTIITGACSLWYRAYLCVSSRCQGVGWGGGGMAISSVPAMLPRSRNMQRVLVSTLTRESKNCSP
jgi:hypothetical protein